MGFGVTFCLIITGSCRGIGQQIGIQIAPRLADGSVILLLSKESSGLQDTKKQIEEVNRNVHVVLETVDLEKEITNEEYAEFIMINNALKQSGKSVSDIQTAILVHNAATIFPLHAMKQNDGERLRRDLQLNFTAPVLLNTQFFQIFDKSIKRRIVVQLSSVSSIINLELLSIYGSVKLARNHFFKTFALEEPTIEVLNYDPGIVDTDMIRDLNKMYPNQTSEDRVAFWEFMGYPLIQSPDTCIALVEILEDSGFESGCFMNYKKDPEFQGFITKRYKEFRSRRASKNHINGYNN